jgi:hypothetical protein
MGSYRTSQTWKIVALLFQSAPMLEEDEQDDKGKSRQLIDDTGLILFLTDEEQKLQEQMSRDFFHESDVSLLGRVVLDLIPLLLTFFRRTMMKTMKKWALKKTTKRKTTTKKKKTKTTTKTTTST